MLPIAIGRLPIAIGRQKLLGGNIYIYHHLTHTMIHEAVTSATDYHVAIILYNAGRNPITQSPSQVDPHRREVPGMRPTTMY